MTLKPSGESSANAADNSISENIFRKMSRITGKHQHWDEFHWEEEIRRDERRISGYFRELPLSDFNPCNSRIAKKSVNPFNRFLFLMFK